jgi:REP element-mobilizing transposase RayT
MSRHWLITSTTYGTWLPGDERGFVSTVRDPSGPPTGPRVRHNQFGTPYDADMPELRESARKLLKAPSIFLDLAKAKVISAQFQETATYREWDMHGFSIMVNHFHVVVTASEEVPSTKILGDFKSYASRALNGRWGKPANGTWWTESGSRRPLPNEKALEDAIDYVLYRQPNPLVVWSKQLGILVPHLSGGR